VERSHDRILTTHVGSLPRPADLVRVYQAQERGEPVDQEAFAARVREATVEVVREQARLGLDVVNDGEVGKPSFLHYVNQRLGGFELLRGAAASPWAESREVADFPDYYAWAAEHTPSPAATAAHMVCTGPISYIGEDALQADIANLKAALDDVQVTEAFIPAISPSNVEDWQRNEHYATDEEFLFAIADAMRVEYERILDAGFLLQVDDPLLLTYYATHPEASVEDCRRWAAVRVEALNHALRGLPPERIRFHSCYSINIGPRVHDMELSEIIDLMLSVRAGAFSFEAANPRHEHEWRVWQEVGVPEEVVLIPGVITHSNVMVEHPEVVADRIVRFAEVVGRENVIAGADCGFASFAGNVEIHPSIVWAKLRSLTEGARIASERLGGRAA
jgi:5-methyltetrahydropteroyltriglutamate--homocysteine methyltransferase